MSLVKYWENLLVFILKQMKVDSGTVSFSCKHLKYGFLHEVLKTGRTRISIFRINFKWFRSRSLWSPKSRKFSIGSLYAATFNKTRKKRKKKVGSRGNFSVWRIFIVTLGTYPWCNIAQSDQNAVACIDVWTAGFIYFLVISSISETAM